MKKLLSFCGFFLVSLAVSVRADTTVVFNEIMYHPATNEPAMEWLELYNQMVVDMDISGWAITGGIDFNFPEGTVLKGRGYLVVALSPDDLMAATGLSGVLGPFTGRLSNNGSQLHLRNNSGRIVDSVNYGVDGDWPVGPDGFGVSLAKYDRDTASAPAKNWTGSDQIGGTPGTDNFPLVGLAPPPTGLLAIDTAWKVESSGTDLGSAWRNRDFDDSAWSSRVNLTEEPITTLFNTGVGDNGMALAAGSADPHYILTEAAQGTVGDQATVESNHSAWLANDSVSSWIGVISVGANNVAEGVYSFQTTFTMGSFVPGSVKLNLTVAVDNTLSNVLINGTSTGISFSGFAGFSAPFTIRDGFVVGDNTLEFLTINEGTSANPGGFRAVLSGDALVGNSANPLPAGRATYYFRKTFSFSGDPEFTRLRLNPLAADGAVYYLNGVEVYRQNMPAGPIDYSTPAVSDVAQPSFAGPMTIPADGLIQGDNVLAVEVHQAAGSADAALLAVEMTSTPLPEPPVTLAFNEVSPSTNDTFFVEIMNYGTNTYDLDGYVIARDGVTNQEHVIASGTSLGPGEFLALTESTLGFKPEDGDKLLLAPPTRHKVLDGLVLKKGARARFPDGTGTWLRPDQATAGGPNSFSFHDEIVINEIMYHHRAEAGTNGLPPQPSPEEWIELYNRSAQAVDLTGWKLSDAVSYDFLPGTTLAAGGYLVVANDAAALQARYPSINIVGSFNKKLSPLGEQIVLEDPTGNPADQVRYFAGGRWPASADGGGSSLELRDPDADNSKGEAWAASDETGKSSWQTYSYRMKAQASPTPAPDGQWHDFVMGLLADGECLVDDVSVVEEPDTAPVPFVDNGNFENGLTGWRVLGTQGHSAVEVDPDNAGNHVLHIISTGPQEHMHNHIETTLSSGRTVSNGREYEISFRAKWLAGNNLLNTRLYFNRAARTTELPAPSLNGTPGAPNSRFEANIGPTFDDLHATPVTPEAGEPVTVTVTAGDPDGVASADLWYSRNGGSWMNVSMSSLGQGRYEGSIPGFAAGSIVQFYVGATDGLGAASTYPAAGPDSGVLYAVADGQADLNLAHNVRIILSPANTALLHAFTNVMSNDTLPCTVVYDENRPYYNMGVRLKGSERGRYSDIRVSYHLEFPPEDPFRGVHPVMLVDRSGAGDSTANKQEEIVIKHMLHHAGGIPGTYADMCRVIAPQSQHTGPAQLFPRFEDEFAETAFNNGGNGTIWELELIYYPTSANGFGYKNPQPDTVQGLDIQDQGDGKELYRYNFIIKNHRDQDDYSPFIAFAKPFSLTGSLLDSQTRQTMDLDEWMRVWALVSLCGVGDSYTFGNNHNLLMFNRPSDHKMVAFPWDMDFSFTQSATASLVGNQNLSKIINLPGNLRRFYGHIVDIIDTTYNATYMTYWANHYDDFAPGQDYSGAVSYIQTRGNFALNTINAAGGNSAFSVAGPEEFTTSQNLVSLSGTAPVRVHTVTVNGREYPLTWNSVSSWTLQVPIFDATNVLHIEGYDLHGNLLTNRDLTVTYTGATPDPRGNVVFNEIMYHPATPGAGYVELFNRSADVSFDLSGWRINGLGYTFPDGFVITNGQYIVLAENLAAFGTVYGSSLPVAGVYDGVLDVDGETLTLIEPGSEGAPDVQVDKVHYEVEPPWSTTPNGGGPSLQLTDASQDNSRVSNWTDGAGWRFFSFTAPAGGTASRLYFWLTNAGDVYLDDVELVKGDAPGSGPNILVDGGFESGVLTAPWVAAGNHVGSEVTTEKAHAGNASLHVIATGAGSAASAIYQSGLSGFVSTDVYTLSFYYFPSSTNGLNFRLTSPFRNLTPIDVTPTQSSPGAPNTSANVLPPYDPAWLNEVQSDNVSGPTDGAGQHDPWIELYNSSASPVSLDGYFLANQYDNNLTQWPFPAGTALAPGEFKVVWVDGDSAQSSPSELHASFRLTSSTGAVALVRLVGGAPQITDYLNYKGLKADQSYGDVPDGESYKRAVFTSVTPGAANIARPVDVYINEWLAANTASVADPVDGNFEDWFELYNAGEEEVDLTGYYLTDNLNNKTQFQIPSGYVIPARGFLLVWADNEPYQNAVSTQQLHVNFALSQTGESIGLFSPAGISVDEVTFGSQTNDVSQGRFPDGAVFTTVLGQVTPGAPNVLEGGNTAPRLDPIADQTLLLGQTLDLAVGATDDEAPPQSLTFSLLPGAPVGATINGATGQFLWTPVAGQAPSTNEVTVRVTDDGVPPLADEKSFVIVVLISPQIEIVTSGDHVSLALPTIKNKTYRILYADSLTPPVNWIPLGGDFVATGDSHTLDDVIGANRQRFYQVLQVD
jgi:Lamin Tail Domain/Putative Ig domain